MKIESICACGSVMGTKKQKKKNSGKRKAPATINKSANKSAEKKDQMAEDAPDFGGIPDRNLKKNLGC
ncbi:MAG: hypothetical protein SH819_01060 [Cytophagales bacterium]|nr:hypothetical protein [Cytophagales bacterium]